MSEMAPMTQEQLDLEAHWRMPEIKVGTQVVWHNNWNDPLKPILAFVTRVSMRSIECITYNGESQLLVRDVLHMTDPRLERNPHMQRNGSWDYSPAYKQAMEFEKRLLVLERHLPMLAQSIDEVPVEEGDQASLSTPLGGGWTPERREKQRQTLERKRQEAVSQ